MLDTIDITNPHKEMDDYFDKKMKAGMTKLKHNLKNEQLLNYLGGAANQASTPTNNGQDSRKGQFSHLDSLNFQIQEEGKEVRQKIKPNKGNQKGSTNSTTKKSKSKNAKSGSQGGSQGGGKQKGAARR